jgi:uncharacterized protein YcfL
MVSKYKHFLFLLLFSFLLVGCSTNNSNKSTSLEEAQNKLAEAQKLYEEETKAKNQATKQINVQIQSATYSFNTLDIDVEVVNNTDREYYITSTDFTLTDSSGLTINPKSSTIRTFEGITLQSGQKMNGKLSFDVEDVGVYKLSYNHRDYPQTLTITVK